MSQSLDNVAQQYAKLAGQEPAPEPKRLKHSGKAKKSKKAESDEADAVAEE